MLSNKQGMNQEEIEPKDWAELVLYVSDIRYLNTAKIAEWESIFHRLIITAPFQRPDFIPGHLTWKVHKEDTPKADIWNRILVEECSRDWVLFVEDEEKIRFSDFPSLNDIKGNKWPPALLIYTEKDKQLQFYQCRFVYNQRDGEKVFDGVNLPDCTRFITKNDIGLSNMPVLIEKSRHPYEAIDPDEELSIANYSPQLYLVQGEMLFKNRKYVNAAGQYRQLLKAEKLLPFDRLAGVNGLASCLAEQYKWDKALALVKKSLEAEPFQNLPYLIEFKIFQLQKKWPDAFTALNKYYERIDLYSRSNYDLTISEEETMINLADLALKAGMREQASNILNDLFNLKNGKVEDEFIQKLLLLSIELSDRNKAIFFFNQMFDGYLPKGLNEERQQALNDYMTMFMQKEWYEFVHDTYTELYQENNEEDEYRRRLIVASIKTNRVEYARKLAAKVA